MRESGVDAQVITGGLRAWTQAGYDVEPVPADDLILLPTFG
jgi:rhodanese-related sulfurtransferase